MKAKEQTHFNISQARSSGGPNQCRPLLDLNINMKAMATAQLTKNRNSVATKSDSGSTFTTRATRAKTQAAPTTSRVPSTCSAAELDGIAASRSI